MEPDIDLAYSLDFLERLNLLEVDGVPLGKRTIFGKYAVWQFFQMDILYNQFNPFTQRQAESADSKVAPTPYTRIGIFLPFFALLSFFSIVWWFLSRPKVIVYSVDKVSSKKRQSDFRLEKIYEFLYTHEISYGEIFHSLLGRGGWNNFTARKRPGIYIEAIDALYNLTRIFKEDPVPEYGSSLMGFTEEEQKIVRTIIPQYLKFIERAEFRVRFFEMAFKIVRPKSFWLIDDTRNYNELILGAQRAGVSTYAFQHGHYTKYHVGFLNVKGISGEIVRPDRLYVWSEYWKEELIRLNTYFTPEELHIGGDPRQEQVVPRGEGEDDGVLSILYPYEIDGYKQEVAEHFEHLLSCPNVHIYFKLRQDIGRELQFREYDIHRFEGKRFHVVTYTDDIEHLIDIVAGTYSTFLYHMVEKQIPVILLKTASDFGEGLLINKLAEEVGKNVSCEEIEKIAQTSLETLQDRHKRLVSGGKELSETLNQLAIEIGIL